MNMKVIEAEVKAIARFDESMCKTFRTRIKLALREIGKLPVGIRANAVVNRTFLRLIGQKDLSSLEASGFVANLNYRG